MTARADLNGVNVLLVVQVRSWGRLGEATVTLDGVTAASASVGRVTPSLTSGRSLADPKTLDKRSVSRSVATTA